MLRSYRHATLILAAATVPVMACKNHNEEPAVFETVAMTEGSDSTVHVEDGIWVEMADQTREHLMAARKDIVNRQWDAASAALRKSSAFLKLEAKKSTKPNHDRLLERADELDHLATEMKEDNLADMMSLDRTIGRAYHTLALHYRQRAEAAQSADQSTTAIAYLQEAVSETEQGFEQVGVAPDSTAQRAIDDASALTADDAPDTISAGLDDLGIAIEHLETALISGNAS